LTGHNNNIDICYQAWDNKLFPKHAPTETYYQFIVKRFKKL